MTEYLTEQEQIDLLKGWIKQYSLVILSGVVMAGIVIMGWRYWQQRQNKIMSHASALYDEMLTSRAQNDSQNMQNQADKLMTHYGKTVYSEMAAFALARDATSKKDFTTAESQLRFVITQGHVVAFRQIARIRLARVLLAEQKPEESLHTLSKVDDKTFNGLIDEVRGDAYLALKKIDMARESYQKALDELPNAEVMRPLLQMKYDNLATTHQTNS